MLATPMAAAMLLARAMGKTGNKKGSSRSRTEYVTVRTASQHRSVKQLTRTRTRLNPHHRNSKLLPAANVSMG